MKKGGLFYETPCIVGYNTAMQPAPRLWSNSIRLHVWVLRASSNAQVRL